MKILGIIQRNSEISLRKIGIAAGLNSPGFKVIRSPYPGILWENYSVGDVIDYIHILNNRVSHGLNANRENYSVGDVIDYIQTAIRENVVDSLLVEPVLGEGGYVVPPEGFLKALRKLCDENNIIMIVDEVQAGMGRTGKMWAFEHDGIKPDIVCAGKSVGGGIPMSLVYYRGDFDEKLPTPFHLGTYRANPLALAAGKEVLKRTPAVLDSVKERGKYLLKAFGDIDSDVIAQVRGKGFMIGIELGKNGRPVDSNTMAKYKKLLIENGLIMHTCGHYGNTFRFMGALNIDQKLLDTGVQIFEKVVRTKW